MILPEFETDLYKYMTGIIQKKDHKMLAINGLSDHVHVLAGVRPKESISDICESLKVSSSKWVNDNHLTPERFQWQGGFGAFSYSLSELPAIIRYIEKQKLTHESIKFRDEYLPMLNETNISYDGRFLFEFFD